MGTYAWTMTRQGTCVWSIQCKQCPPAGTMRSMMKVMMMMMMMLGVLEREGKQ
jgi:hypothetical protein